jgi:hypothetical protein
MSIEHAFRALTLTLTLGGGLLGCDADAPDPEHEAAELRGGSLYDGEALFLGIFLGQGEVAERLPLSWGGCDAIDRGRMVADLPVEVLMADVERLLADPRHEAMWPQLERARQTLLDEGVVTVGPNGMALLVELVRERDPEFFGRLEQAVGSGEHDEIEKILKEGHELVRDVVVIDLDPGGPIEDGLVVVYETAIVIDSVYAYIQYWTTVGVVVVAGQNPDQSRLFQELMVDEIATELAVH